MFVLSWRGKGLGMGVKSYEPNEEPMAFDLHISIPENSPAGQVIQRLSQSAHITPEQAVTQILAEVAARKTPAEEMWGAFSSDEDSALMDGVLELVQEGRRTPTTRDIGL